ncbi:MAG: hypothetical protein ACKO42_00960 [Gammaproteobacteria bacterium]
MRVSTSHPRIRGQALAVLLPLLVVLVAALWWVAGRIALTASAPVSVSCYP